MITPLKLAKLIGTFHEQAAQWSQFMSTEMGFNMEEQVQYMDIG